jgi:hypothetical protein
VPSAETHGGGASERALAAAGHAGALQMHIAIEYNAVRRLANGVAWVAAYEGVPIRERHLALHQGHLEGVNDRDRPFVTGGLLSSAGAALDVAGWREKLATLASQGATAVAYQPAGPDVAGDLEAFMAITSFMLVEHAAAATARPPEGNPGYERILTAARRPAATTDAGDAPRSTAWRAHPRHPRRVRPGRL